MNQPDKNQKPVIKQILQEPPPVNKNTIPTTQTPPEPPVLNNPNKN